MAATLTCPSISCEQLCQLLKTGQDAVVLDSRCFQQYQIKHVQGSLAVRMSALLLRRLVSGKINVGDIVCDEDKKWSSRSVDGLVVVYDDDASFQESVVIDKTNPLHAILCSLQATQQNCVFLHGGFTAFEAAQPSLVVSTSEPAFPGSQVQFSHQLTVPCTVKSSPIGMPSTPFSLTPRAGPPSYQQSFAHPSPFARNLGQPVQTSIFGGFCARQPICQTVEMHDRFHQNPVGVEVQRAAAPWTTSITCPSPQSFNERRSSLPMSKVLDWLYLGSKRDACNETLLSEHNITFVLNLTKDLPNFFESNPKFNYCQIRIDDCFNQNIQQYFETAFQFLDQASSCGQNILVHCHAGISRSAAFVIAYLMRSNCWNLDEAHAFVLEKREIISPNLDFLGELKEFESTLFAQRL